MCIRDRPSRRGKIMYPTTIKIAVAAIAVLLLTSAADARRGGACDGFQRCRCGTTAARYHGLPYSYKGFNLKLASEWARAFPHTSFGVGVAGVKPHHVLTVVGGSSCASATVSDDAGTYQRNVCRMTFVAVGGGGLTRESSARSHRHHLRRYASR